MDQLDKLLIDAVNEHGTFAVLNALILAVRVQAERHEYRGDSVAAKRTRDRVLVLERAFKEIKK